MRCQSLSASLSSQSRLEFIQGLSAKVSVEPTVGGGGMFAKVVVLSDIKANHLVLGWL